MAKHPKDHSALDIALSDVLKELLDASPLSLRGAAKAAGMSHNRLGKITRHDTPPASPGEIDHIAKVFGTTASAVFAAAELRLVSSDGYALAASDPRADETSADGNDAAAEDGQSV